MAVSGQLYFLQFVKISLVLTVASVHLNSIFPQGLVFDSRVFSRNVDFTGMTHCCITISSISSSCRWSFPFRSFLTPVCICHLLCAVLSLDTGTGIATSTMRQDSVTGCNCVGGLRWYKSRVVSQWVWLGCRSIIDNTGRRCSGDSRSKSLDRESSK